MLRLLCAICIVLGAGGAWAQSEKVEVDGATLAEIRLEIEGLARILGDLKQELAAPDPQTTGIVNPGPLQQRVAETSAEVQRLQGEIEKLELRIQRIVADGNNRIGDLEFRLIELSDGDYSAYEEPPSLGEGKFEGTVDAIASTSPQPRETGNAGASGGTTQAAVPAPVETPAAPGVASGGNQPELAETEQQAFDQAMALYNRGDYQRAANGFMDFIGAYPNGPLTGQAAFWRGESLAAAGDWPNAARSYLESFSGAPQGAKAPEALYRLGLALGRLDQNEEACLTLREVRRRYPSIPADLGAKVDAERQALNCS